jgi:hypothetical protein
LVDRRYSPLNKNCLSEKLIQNSKVRPHDDKGPLRISNSKNHQSTEYDCKESQDAYHYPIHQLQVEAGINWIVIGECDRVYDQTNSYFKVIRQPNGDIYLKQVDIYANPKNMRIRQPSAAQILDNPEGM